MRPKQPQVTYCKGAELRTGRYVQADRVLAGCCWEVHATRADPEELLSSLRQVSKCLTLLLALFG